MVVGVVEGPNAISVVRTTMGATNAAEAIPGTIRGDYAREIDFNIIHGSDGPETAAQEIDLFLRLKNCSVIHSFPINGFMSSSVIS